MLTEAERELWVDQIQARAAQIQAQFEKKDSVGIVDDWIIPSGGTSTTGSRTPTGLLTPPPVKDIAPSKDPWAGTTAGYSSAVELTERLERLEKEHRLAGIQFKVRFDENIMKMRAFPDDGEQTSDSDASSSSTSSFFDDEEYQHLGPLTAPSYPSEDDTPSSTASTSTPRTFKRQRDPELSSPDPKRRKTSVQVVIPRLPVLNSENDMAQVVSKPVDQPSGRLARDIGQDVRRRSKTSGLDRKKRKAIKQGKTREPYEHEDYTWGSKPLQKTGDTSGNKPLQNTDSSWGNKSAQGTDYTWGNKITEACKEDKPTSSHQVEEASSATNNASSSNTDHGQRVGPTRTKHKSAKDQKLYSPYARTGRSVTRPVNEELSLDSTSEFDEGSNASSPTVRTRKKTLNQQQLENVGTDTDAPLRNTSSKPRPSKKTPKKTGAVPIQGPSSRITRSQTHPSFPFVELDEHGEAFPALGPNFNSHQKYSLKRKREKARRKKRSWERIKKEAVERYFVSQAWKECFAEHGMELEMP